MIRLEAYLTGFRSRSDGSAGLSFTTQELSAEEFGLLKEQLNQFGWLVFKGNEIVEADIPDAQAEDKNKTPSKRLRSVVFIEWVQKGKVGDFETFYREKLDKIINHIKSKLD